MMMRNVVPITVLTSLVVHGVAALAISANSVVATDPQSTEVAHTEPVASSETGGISESGRRMNRRTVDSVGHVAFRDPSRSELTVHGQRLEIARLAQTTEVARSSNSAELQRTRSSVTALVFAGRLAVKRASSGRRELLTVGGIVSAGDRIEGRDRALLLCSTDRALEVERGEKAFGEELCTLGRSVGGQMYAAMSDAHRGTNVLHLLEVTMRGPGEFGIPVLLTPRFTRVLGGRPEIVWTPVPGAIEYEVELGIASDGQHRIAVDEAECAVASRDSPWASLEVCSMAWPTNEPDLAPGERRFLAVGSRRLLSQREPHTEDDLPSIERIGREEAERLATELDDLAFLGVTGEERLALEVAILSDHRLHAEALRRLAGATAPELVLRRGELLLSIRLPWLALDVLGPLLESQHGLTTSQRIRAEAAMGVAHDQEGDRHEALEHLERALELAEGEGDEDRVFALERALLMVRERLGP